MSLTDRTDGGWEFGDLLVPTLCVGTHFLDAPRFRGFLDYFPPARASFSSGIRGGKKTALAAGARFLGENAIFRSEYFPSRFFSFSEWVVVR
jgi:hypothetical protein